MNCCTDDLSNYLRYGEKIVAGVKEWSLTLLKTNGPEFGIRDWAMTGRFYGVVEIFIPGRYQHC